jgi:hypothetical protein
MVIFKVAFFYNIVFALARYVVFPALDFFDASLIQVTTIISVIVWIYMDLFAAHSLKFSEQKGNVKFTDLIGDFFSFAFYPFGVWWLQPRINRASREKFSESGMRSALDGHMIQ